MRVNTEPSHNDFSSSSIIALVTLSGIKNNYPPTITRNIVEVIKIELFFSLRHIKTFKELIVFNYWLAGESTGYGSPGNFGGKKKARLIKD